MFTVCMCFKCYMLKNVLTAWADKLIIDLILLSKPECMVVCIKYMYNLTSL